MTVTWKDPPPVKPLAGGYVPTGRPNYETNRIISEIMVKPGKWALVKTVDCDTGTVQSLRTSLQRQGAEVTQRTAGHTVDVYARWPAT